MTQTITRDVPAERKHRTHRARFGVVLALVVVLTAACRLPGMVAEPALGERFSPDFPSVDGPPRALVDVRAWPHPGFDRVVLEFSTALPPSWLVRSVDAPLREIGSGEPVAVDGTAFIEIRATRASAFDRSSGDAVLRYLGPERLTVTGSGIVTEIVAAGEFEQTLVWIIGLRHGSPFAAVGYESPGRIVVDVLATPPSS
jgi:hypothetical protein